MPTIGVRSLKAVLLLAIGSATMTIAAPPTQAQFETVWSVGGSVGLAPPVGGWKADLDPGTEYRVSVIRGRVGSRWALDAELARHAYTLTDAALAARDTRAGRGFIRQTSLGVGVRYTLREHSPLSTWVSGSLAAHSVRTSMWDHEHPSSFPLLLRDEYVPGMTAGIGLALGSFRIQPVAEVRLRVVGLRERTLISVPIAVGLRF